MKGTTVIVLNYAGTAKTVTRETQDLGLIYLVEEQVRRGRGDVCFFTPDGLGRIWFDSLPEAVAESGIDRVVLVLSDPED
jgi:hypothetical protein